eukprot:CAMPEP_0170184238 /NCGR_PEP_ID=MMETSP0040_2-20121228/33048_1 /TAXON_ID=641309 /ORGANISM="Lotharella oceanica, Strain CCMP622" /LENGTH=88 /DNA_ID=CAMNT_0010430217 /DNA_START=305 /DNA_END=571 /DNA_ORIENTATION=-
MSIFIDPDHDHHHLFHLHYDHLDHRFMSIIIDHEHYMIMMIMIMIMIMTSIATTPEDWAVEHVHVPRAACPATLAPVTYTDHVLRWGR